MSLVLWMLQRVGRVMADSCTVACLLAAAGCIRGSSSWTTLWLRVRSLCCFATAAACLRRCSTCRRPSQHLWGPTRAELQSAGVHLAACQAKGTIAMAEENFLGASRWRGACRNDDDYMHAAAGPSLGDKSTLGTPSCHKAGTHDVAVNDKQLHSSATLLLLGPGS